MEQSTLLKTLDLTENDVVMIIVFALLFVVFLKLVAAKLFAPFMMLTEAREAATTGAQDVANQQLTEAREIEAKIEDRLAQVRVAGVKSKNEVIASAKQTAQKIIDDAEQIAQKEVAIAKEKLRSEIGHLKNQLDNDCSKMVDSILADLKEPAKAASLN